MGGCALSTSSTLATGHPLETNQVEIAQSVYDELIAWSVKLNSGMASAEDLQHFAEWRAQHPAHEMAWQTLYAVEQGLGALPAESKQVAVGALQFADKQASRVSARRRTLKRLSLVAVTMLVTALVVNQYAPWQQELHYITSVGNRETVLLADGTRLMLNTNSQVDVKFSLLKREIVLHRGEIYMDTGKDSDAMMGRRSFWVNTGQAKLEAIGTRFSVNQQVSGTQLHVAQGIVAMHVGDHTPVRAYANETYTMPDAVSAPLNVSASHQPLAMDPMAWIDGMLVVKQMRLDAFAAELSRYQDIPLVCAPSAAALTVSGVFQLNRQDPVEHALKAVARTLPVRTRMQDGVVFISKK